MARITKQQWKQANAKRYRDLHEELSTYAIGASVHFDDKILREMKMIAAIAKLHGVDVKEPE